GFVGLSGNLLGERPELSSHRKLRMGKKTIWLTLSATAALTALAFTVPAWSDSWFERQTLTSATMKRLNVGWNSCCLGSEVVKTKFRVDKTSNGDEWYYLKEDNTWKRV